MKRKTALKLFGAIIIFYIGASKQMCDKLSNDHPDIEINWMSIRVPMDFILVEKQVNNLIIEKSDGNKIEIPFSEIIQALEEDIKNDN